MQWSDHLDHSGMPSVSSVITQMRGTHKYFCILRTCHYAGITANEGRDLMPYVETRLRT